MIESITLENFKCFYDKTSFELAPITLLYGKNGRGKSSLAQSLSLIAQTMQQKNDINNGLLLVGRLVELGSYLDIKNSLTTDAELSISLRTSNESVCMAFSPYADKPQMARLSGLVVNGVDRFDVSTDETGLEVDDVMMAVTTSDIILLQNLKSLQYVSADRKGPRNYSPRKDSLSPDWQGAEGEYVINVLADKGIEFQNQVCEVLSEVLSGASLRVTSGVDRVELFLNSVDGDIAFRPKNVGFGYSYVLPVIVAALLAKKDSVLIIENPEAHLHPGAQSRLMKFLIRVSKERGVQLIVETHSDHVINGLRIAMKQRYCDISPADANLLFFSHSEDVMAPEVETIKCDSKGELSAYPDDFMDEWTKQLIQLL